MCFSTAKRDCAAFLSDPTVGWEHLARLNPTFSAGHALLVMIDERLRAFIPNMMGFSFVIHNCIFLLADDA